MAKLEKLIKLAAIGDIALSHEYDRLLVSKGPDYPLAKVRDYLKGHDIVLANLEAPFCRSGETYPLKCSLRVAPEYAKGIKTAGIDVVSLANNHIFDYREEAFLKTREVLDENQIKYFGAGSSLSEARDPVVVNVKDIAIGFIGYCDVQIDSPFYASETTRGIAPLNLEYVKADIEKLKKKVNIIVVSLHWGIENWFYPTPQQREQAHKIIDYGANLIVGHHPHVLHGMEQYKQGHILYSLGNFLFSDIDWSWTNQNSETVSSRVVLEKRNRESAVCTILMNREGIEKIAFKPCVIGKDGQVAFLPDDSTSTKRIEMLSRALKKNGYEKFWNKYHANEKIKAASRNVLKRLKKIHRIRPKHFKELKKMIIK